MEKKVYIDGNETNFWIEDTGRLRNEKTKHYLKGGVNKGYHFYNLWFRGKNHIFYTHRLVAETFLPNPENLPIVHHIDGNKLNNNVNNLQWISTKEHEQKHLFQKIGRTYKQEYIGNEDLSKLVLKQFRDSPYFCSKDGNIYNLEKRIKIKLEKSGKYLRFQGAYNLNHKKFLVHRVVWEAFNGPIPEGMDIDHIDGNPHNNHLDNLQIVSHSDNCKKAKHNNIEVYSVHKNTGEKNQYSSLRQASYAIFGSRVNNTNKVKEIIENHTLVNNCYWYYKE